MFTFDTHSYILIIQLHMLIIQLHTNYAIHTHSSTILAIHRLFALSRPNYLRRAIILKFYGANSKGQFYGANSKGQKG